MKETALTIGKFDAVHIGHQELIKRTQRHKDRKDVRIGMLVLNMHTEYLISAKEREYLLKDKLDFVEEITFSEEMKQMSPEMFVTEVLQKKYHMKYLTVGTDFRFGYQKKGDIQMLQEFSQKYQFSLEIIEKKVYEGREVSSSWIRELLKEGNLTLANRLLGYPYLILGTVQRGREIGRTIDVPTMNLHPEEKKILPLTGVYISQAMVEGKLYHSITDIGKQPSVSDEERLKIETNLFDYEKDAYGKEIQVSLLAFIRSDMKFESIEALKEQIKQDKERARAYFA